MHVEDSNLGSFNLVIMNLNNYPPEWPSKLWIIVVDNQKLIDVVRRHYRPSKKSASVCQYILHHKNLFISFDLLKKHGIQYSTLLQYPGDCVYIAPGVFHQVINLTLNLVEAINFADGFWNKLIEHLNTCNCPDNKYVILSSNPDADVKFSTHQMKSYVCPEPNCEFVSWDKQSFDAHLQESHPAISNPSDDSIWCYVCRYPVSQTNLSRHRDLVAHNRDYILSLINFIRLNL
ncbi:hypothetical protein QAD02_009597 [Eretmocerus hayati]|uniref:Uncharacterized protein n=1 Tax=Eretmocerus hayati TaxID=131215 RepID=A0ACC2NA48_9HYME|nr:hypothetical protein QAD02_009597 [Eretmocerus hayati]